MTSRWMLRETQKRSFYRLEAVASMYYIMLSELAVLLLAGTSKRCFPRCTRCSWIALLDAKISQLYQKVMSFP